MEWNRELIDSISFRKYSKWDVLVSSKDVRKDWEGGTYLIEGDLLDGRLDFAGGATMYESGSIHPDKPVENKRIKCFGWFSWSIEPMFFEFWREKVGPQEELSIFEAQRIWDEFVRQIKSLQA